MQHWPEQKLPIERTAELSSGKAPQKKRKTLYSIDTIEWRHFMWWWMGD